MNMLQCGMITSALLRQKREELVLLCKRMTPEERVMAYFHHSQMRAQLLRLQAPR